MVLSSQELLLLFREKKGKLFFGEDHAPDLLHKAKALSVVGFVGQYGTELGKLEGVSKGSERTRAVRVRRAQKQFSKFKI